MNISNIRKEIFELDNERKELIKFVLSSREMIKGTLYQSARVCGNPNCKCARGERHVSWYLIVNRDGRSRQDYVGAKVPLEIQERVDLYQEYKKLVMRIRLIDRKVSKLLNSLRDLNSIPMEEIKTKTK